MTQCYDFQKIVLNKITPVHLCQKSYLFTQTIIKVTSLCVKTKNLINNKEYLRFSLFLVFCYQNHFDRFINQWITTLESTIQLIKLIKYFLCMYWDIIYPDLITLVSQKETKTNIISVDNAVFLNIIISFMNPKHKFLLKCIPVIYVYILENTPIDPKVSVSSSCLHHFLLNSISISVL